MEKKSNVFTNAGKVRVGVIGDLMLDCFVYGGVTRISPEAPSAILTYDREVKMLGGAGNVAAGIHALGASVDLVGVLGPDSAGLDIRNLLKEQLLSDRSLVTVREMTTTKKTRYVSRNHHILRVDHETYQGHESLTRDRIRNSIEKNISKWDVVVIADYNKKMLDANLIAWVSEKARARSLPVIVDAKPNTLLRYSGATLVTPNLKEAQEVTREHNPDVAALTLQKKLKSAVLVTLGENGMLLRVGKEEYTYPALARGVIDVSGAGDTVVATTAVALACGNTLPDAVNIANHAASIVVQKPGTAVVSREELEEKINSDTFTTNHKVHTIESLTPLLEAHRHSGKRVVFTNGVFDLLHEGHVSVLEVSKTHGDVLVVGVNTDDSVKRLKGPERPTLPLDTRMRMLAALSAVDYVVSFCEDTPLRLIKKILPDVLVKGGDYTEDTIVGADIVRARGGRIVVVDLVEGKSTTHILHKIRGNK